MGCERDTKKTYPFEYSRKKKKMLPLLVLYVISRPIPLPLRVTVLPITRASIQLLPLTQHILPHAITNSSSVTKLLSPTPNPTGTPAAPQYPLCSLIKSVIGLAPLPHSPTSKFHQDCHSRQKAHLIPMPYGQQVWRRYEFLFQL